MRCPKCGSISFDHQETCSKCLKYIGDVVAEVNGTTHSAKAPVFLKVTSADRFPTSLSAEKAKEQEKSFLPESEDSFALEADEETEFVLDHAGAAEQPRGEIEFPGGQESFLMELDDITETSPRDEFTLDLGEKTDEKPQLPSMDFGDLDISDLAPPAKEDAEPIHFVEQPVLSDLEPIATRSETLSPLPPTPSASSPLKAGLEDLNFSGLDLDTPSKLIGGNTTGKQYLPSVKTGTALDKFDIDLGELFPENKK